MNKIIIIVVFIMLSSIFMSCSGSSAKSSNSGSNIVVTGKVIAVDKSYLAYSTIYLNNGNSYKIEGSLNLQMGNTYTLTLQPVNKVSMAWYGDYYILVGIREN